MTAGAPAEGRPGTTSDDGPARRVVVGDPRRGALTGMGETIAIGLIVAAKFALPLLILQFPFAAGWAINPRRCAS